MRVRTSHHFSSIFKNLNPLVLRQLICHIYPCIDDFFRFEKCFVATALITVEKGDWENKEGVEKVESESKFENKEMLKLKTRVIANARL